MAPSHSHSMCCTLYCIHCNLYYYMVKCSVVQRTSQGYRKDIVIDQKINTVKNCVHCSVTSGSVWASNFSHHINQWWALRLIILLTNCSSTRSRRADERKRPPLMYSGGHLCSLFHWSALPFQAEEQFMSGIMSKSVHLGSPIALLLRAKERTCGIMSGSAHHWHIYCICQWWALLLIIPPFRSKHKSNCWAE